MQDAVFYEIEKSREFVSGPLMTKVTNVFQSITKSNISKSWSIQRYRRESSTLQMSR